jgi:phosphoserine phosphatase
MRTITKLLITRHGETQWNLEKRFQGSGDSPLTENGIRQAILLGERLQKVPLDCIYTSSSPRALKTTELIRGQRSIEVIATEALKEMNLGSWEGQRGDDIKAREPERWHAFWNNPPSYKPDQGESYPQVQERVLGVLNSIMTTHVSKNILIVTHGVIFKAIMAYFENRPLERLWDPPYIQQTCLSIVEIGQQCTEILLHADTSHLVQSAE